MSEGPGIPPATLSGIVTEDPEFQAGLARTNTGAGELLSSGDVLEYGRAFARMGVPLQIGNLLDALAQLRARAAGSTAAIFPSIMGQIEGLRTQYGNATQALGRRLGFAGGGQTVREQQGALGQAARQYAMLLGGAQQAGFSNLMNTLGGIQPAVSGAARPPSTRAGTAQAPNYGLYGQSIAGILSGVRAIQGASQAGVATPAEAQSAVETYRQQYAPQPEMTSEATLWGSTV